MLEDQYHAPIRRLGASTRAQGARYARLLDFIERSDTALRMSACLSLGAFHTAVLGVAEAVPGLPPARRVSPKRTDARSFCNRRDIADVPPFQMDAAATQYRWGDAASLGLLGDANGRAAVSEDEDSRPATEPVHTALAERRDEFGVGVAANTETVCEFNPLDPDAFKPAPPLPDDARDADDCELITPAAAAAAREKSGAAQPAPHRTARPSFHGQARPGRLRRRRGSRGRDVRAEACIADATPSRACPAARRTAALDPAGALMTWGPRPAAS